MEQQHISSELTKILNSAVVKCPNNDCSSYGSYHQCFNHSYAVCPTFFNWYNGLSNEQVHIIYNQ